MMTAASFLHKYEQTGGTKLEEVREQLGPAGPFRIKLIQKLPPSAPEGSARKREAKSYVGEGEGSSAKEARNMARINLVKRLFGVLKMPHSYLPKDKQAQKAVSDKVKPTNVSAAKEKEQSSTEASSTAKKKAKTANAKTTGETSGRRLKNKPKKEAKKTAEASKLEVTKKTQNELFAADTVLCEKVEATEPVTAPLEAVGKDDIQSLLFPKTPTAKLMPNAVNVTASDLKKLATSTKQKSNTPATTKQKPNTPVTTKQKAKALTTLSSPVETVKIDVKIDMKIDQKAVDPKANKKVAMREKRKKMAQNKENVLCTTAKLTTETLAMREEMTDLAMQLEAMDLPMQAEYKKRPEEDSHCYTFQDRSHYVDALQDVSMFGDLPIRAFAREILRTIEGNQVTVISAATGSGKTTQVPQYILELYKQNRARTNVIVTQPRRIAAISIAKRVAAELKETLCKSVGYSVRFDNKVAHSNNGSSTVNLVTAGILLKMLQGDPLLKRVTHLILDEVHERDLFTDTLLLIIKQRLLEKRPDLKVILMSATLSSEKLIKYFEGSGNIKVGKVLEIAGTNYPIASYYLDDIKKMCPGAEEDAETREYYEAEEEFINPTAKTSAPSRSKEKKCSKLVPHNLLARMIAKIDGEGEQGGILVFLPGWEEMMNVMKHLAGRIGPDSSYRVYLLHSTGSVQCDLSTGLPLAEEDTADVFSRAPPGIRKIVLATNIAESSVTIPDVVHVIDSGKQKIIYYDSALRINCLQMAWASKANTKQRMGRAGRCQPGKYYAVMCEKRFEGLLETIPPEIARLDLAEAALGIKASGLEGDLPSILRNCCDPPEEKLAQMAAQELVSLGAFRAEDHSLTPLGRALARFPIHPRLSRMLLTSILMRCSDDIISTVATIGERPYKPARTDVEKTQLRRSIKALVEGDEWGDHLMLTNVLEDWKSHYFRHPSLSFTGLKKMHSAKMQYEKSLENTLKMSLLSLEEDDYESVEGDPWKVTRFVLSTGFYPDIAVQWRKNIFWAIGMPQVKLLPVSCEYEVSALSLEQDGSGGGVEAGLQDIQSILMRTSTSLEEQNKRVRPKFYVFEELMDTGSSIKSMRRVTAIDPLFLVLSANNVKMTNVPTEEGISNSNSSSSGSGSDKGAAGLMMIDDFIRLEVDRDTAGLMLELRALWKQILAVGIPLLVHGQREPLIERASTLVRSIVRRESDIFRRTKHDLRKQQ